MSYRPGRMGVGEGVGLVFILLLPRVFLTTPALSLIEVCNSAWMLPLVAFGAAAAAFFLMAAVMGKNEGDLYAVSGRLLGPAGALLLALVYAACFLLDAALLLRQFAENTLLTALPETEFRVVIFWYAIFIAGLVCFGIEGIARAAYLLLPFVAGGVMLVLFLLVKFYDPTQLMPWQGAGLEVVVERSLLLSGLNFGGVLLYVLAPQFQTAGTVRTAFLFGGGGGALLRSLMIAAFIMAFGVAKGLEKTLPFFDMTRLVYLSRYIERIESLFVVIWVIVGLLAIAIDLYAVLFLLSRVLRLPTIRPLVPVLAVGVVNLAVLPSDIDSVIDLESSIATIVFTPVMLGAAALLYAAAWLRERRGKG